MGEKMSVRKGVSSAVQLVVVAVCVIALTLTLTGLLVALVGKGAGERDVVQYWVTGKLLLNHENPFDGARVLGIERAVGFPAGLPPLVTPNPPWSLAMFVPLGLFGLRAAELIWFLLSALSLIASVRMIGAMHGLRSSWLDVLGYTFAPVLSCLLAGQVTIFILLGLVLFLRFHNSHPFAAGSALWLCMLKPHIFLPFGMVLVLWSIVARKFRVLAGVVCSLGLGSVVAVGLHGTIWQDYQGMMMTTRADRYPIPCVSIALRELVPPHNLAIQSIPVALGCVWAVWYFMRHCREWKWIEHGSLLILVSVLVAPYTWLMDQTVLLPALLRGVYLSRSRVLIGLLALASAVIEFAAISGVPLLHSKFYLWTSPAWLVWYLFAIRSAAKRSDPRPQGVLEAGGNPDFIQVLSGRPSGTL